MWLVSGEIVCDWMVVHKDDATRGIGEGVQGSRFGVGGGILSVL